MDGIRYQIEQLQFALGQIDPHRTIIHEDISQLQLALANTTAIARRVVNRQIRRPLTQNTGINNNNNNEIIISSSSTQANNVDDNGINTLKGMENHISKLKYYETLLTIAKYSGITIDEIRKYNPQLSNFHDNDALPVNTYIKMKLHINQTATLEETPNKIITETPNKEVIIPVEDTMTMDIPLPLAPLPSMQGVYRRSKYIIGREASPDIKSPYGESNNLPRGGRLMLLPSPSPNCRTSSRENSIIMNNNNNNNINSVASMDRYEENYTNTYYDYPTQIKNDDNNNNDNNIIITNNNDENIPNTTNARRISSIPTLSSESAGETVRELPKSISQGRNTTAAKNMTVNSVPVSLSSGSKAGKPPLMNNNINTHTITTTNTIQLNKEDSSSLKRSQPTAVTFTEIEHSLITESSSYHSTPTPTPYRSPQPKKNIRNNEIVNVQNNIKEIVPLTATAAEKEEEREDKQEGEKNVKIIEKSNPEEEEENDDEYLNSNPTSPIQNGEFPLPTEVNDDFDTLNSIAIQYNITVKEVLQWNPYLIVYEADEPLPANLPIVLPLQQ